MKRDIFRQLIDWKSAKNRKPLILHGVRQSGKTYILQKFGEVHFNKTHYINFEQDGRYKQIFANDLDPKRVITELSFIVNSSIDISNDLVIFDEIQDCPRALTSLKYFYEQLPELALCAAGSLLGVHLSSSPFPVGKVDILPMFPMTFTEFLMAVDEQSFDYLEKIKIDTRVPDFIHEHLWKQLKIYFIVGGMPEAVQIYNELRDNLFQAVTEVRKKQQTLLLAYYADVAKHSGETNAMHIDRIFKSVPAQLAQQQDSTAPKFKFSGIIPGINRYGRLVGAIDWLETASLIIKIPIVHCGQLPFIAYTKENVFKLYLFDVGLLGAMSELSPTVIMNYDYGTYKGYFAENFVAQEFVAKGASLYSWQEKQAEVEFIREFDGKVIPVEVKSGWITQSKSAKIFANKYHSPYRVIMSAGRLHIDEHNQIHHYPLYLAGQFPLSNHEKQTNRSG